MGEQRQIRSHSWNRMRTKRCSANGVTNEFILVDDDEVIILDFPETSKSKEKESVLQRVISIDDDDDDDDTENVQKGGSSSRGGNSLGDNLQASADVDNDDCQFIQEKSASFRFSKCKQIFSTVPSSGIRFGLGSETESDFSDSDCSDCEIFEGSHREVREQWEKAFLEKTKKASKAGLSEEAGPSNLHRDTNFGPRFESRTEQHDQAPPFFTARNPDGGKETSSTFFGTEKSAKAGPSEEAGPSDHLRGTNFRSGFDFRTEQHDQTSSFFTARKSDGRKETSSFFFGPETRKSNTSAFGSGMEEDNQGISCANSRVFSKPDFPPGIQVEHEESDSLPTGFTTSNKKQMKKAPKKNPVKKVPKANQKKKAADQSYTKEVEEEEDVPREPIIGSIPSTSGQVQDLHGTAPALDIMLNREMLKETDEYKKAQEEEWESRQRQLQLQAEEAQRQRKRIKLANTRQMEMERRQKERVEEVRETQKKDEESMNMKEKVRAEITKSLKLLELKSFNMASLLQGLGIPVGGGIAPQPHEVHAAYKRAVLKFHPDRASRGDIKQQVEAEEKFKLIARMKDKFMP